MIGDHVHTGIFGTNVIVAVSEGKSPLNGARIRNMTRRKPFRSCIFGQKLLVKRDRLLLLLLWAVKRSGGAT